MNSDDKEARLKELRRLVASETQGNSINAYTCSLCGFHIVTVDRLAGVTPAFLKCRAIVGCLGSMHSSFYRVDQGLRPGWEWYRPGDAEMKRLPAGTRDHVEHGGLLLREIEDGVEAKKRVEKQALLDRVKRWGK